MPDPATPKEGTADTFTYGRDAEGNLLIDGVIVERATGFLSGPGDDDAADEQKGDQNAQVEGAEAPAKEEPKAPEPPAETPPPPEPPKEPEKYKFKLKVQGEELEKELTQEELIARLQMAEDYHRKTSQLADQRRKIEPFLPIIEKPEFKQWLDEQVQLGAIEAPKQAEPPSPADVIGYRLRTAEPEFQEIHGMINEWAATIPQYEWDIINANHRAFNEVYDKFKTMRQDKLKAVAPPPASTPEPPPKINEKILAAKEVAKAQAKVEPPGGQAPEVDPMREWKRIDRELQKAVRSGQRFVTYKGRMMDADVAWAMHRYEPQQ